MQHVKSLLVAIAVFLASTATAQTAVGLRGGINIATITEFQQETGVSLDPTSVIGLNFALYTDLNISEHFGIQPEINYLQKGAEMSGADENEGEFRFKMRVNYLEVPVLAKLRFGAEKLRGFAMVGPSVGYALGGEGTVSIDGVEVTEKIEFDNDLDDDGYKDQRWDVGAVIGAGAALSAGPGNVILDLRYGLDFTDFAKYQSVPADHEKSYNRGFGISLGYQIPINKK